MVKQIDYVNSPTVPAVRSKAYNESALWTYLAMRPWCQSDIAACQAAGVSKASLATWRATYPLFRDLEAGVATHAYDQLWLPKQRVRALVTQATEALSDALTATDGKGRPAHRIRLEAARLAYTVAGMLSSKDADWTRAEQRDTAPDLSALSMSELQSLGSLLGKAGHSAMIGSRMAQVAREEAPGKASDESEQKSD
jgi:hypothetical protein